MGWTSQRANFYKNGTVDRKAEMDSIFKEEDSANGEFHYKTLKSAIVGSTYYAAIEKTNNKTGKKEVFAVICLTSVSNDPYYNFSYKDMDETMGPYKYDCPSSILKLLTPTENKYAKEWREKCNENIKKKYQLEKMDKHGKKGGTIIFYPSSDLQSGRKANEPIKLFWQSISFNYSKKERGFWTDGFFRYPKSLIKQGKFELSE